MSEKFTGKADIHTHTIFSDGLMSPEALIEHVIHHTDLDVLAITDHDTVTGALVGQAYARYFQSKFRPLEVIIGTEVSSADGDILGLFVEEDIPAGKTATETVALIHEQGGLAIAAHPFAHSPLLLPVDGMKGAAKLIATVPFDGVEVRNGTPTELLGNWIAYWYNRRHAKRPMTGGSDTHYMASAGKSYTRFPGKTAEDLRRAIVEGENGCRRTHLQPFPHFAFTA